MLQLNNGLVSAMPTPPVLNIGFKEKRQSVTGKWTWEGFQNSGRNDQAKFFHWTKVENSNSDYPWSKFNTQLERLTYTHEEYNNFLASPTWTKAETDYLVEVCYRYDLRWPVIYDRYDSKLERSSDDLQQRFFEVVSRLKASKYDGSSLSKPDSSFVVMNVDYERNRRQLQEKHFLKYKSIVDTVEYTRI
jgi:DNA methyltransferase 1-associated protein 1